MCSCLASSCFDISIRAALFVGDTRCAHVCVCVCVYACRCGVRACTCVVRMFVCNIMQKYL